VKNSNPIWRREEVTNSFLGSNPRVRDPYERRNVYVAPSTIPGAGEGLFAKRDMEERELVAYLVYGYMHMFTLSLFPLLLFVFYFMDRGSYLFVLIHLYLTTKYCNSDYNKSNYMKSTISFLSFQSGLSLLKISLYIIPISIKTAIFIDHTPGSSQRLY
jgi:hypothetical protein